VSCGQPEADRLSSMARNWTMGAAIWCPPGGDC